MRKKNANRESEKREVRKGRRAKRRMNELERVKKKEWN